MQELAINLWQLLLESAPWLLLGYLIAGFINELMPKQWIHRLLGGEGATYVVRAAFIGAPLPLCSCGVIPAAMGIRRAGASKGATAAFLVATPETGVDSISLTYALMGPFMAVARPVSAIVSAIVTGLSVSFLSQSSEVAKPEVENKEEPPKPTCCHAKKAEALETEQRTFVIKIKDSIEYGLVKMLKDTIKWLAIGLLGAALMKTYVPESFFSQWGDGLLAMVVMVVAGLPMYICASASTPLGAGLMMAGVSPGAALVFMLTGPATNIATLGVIKQELGGRSLIAYLMGVVVTAIVMGLACNALLKYMPLQVMPEVMSHGQHASWWAYASVGVLVLAVLNLLRVRIFRDC